MKHPGSFRDGDRHFDPDPDPDPDFDGERCELLSGKWDLNLLFHLDQSMAYSTMASRAVAMKKSLLSWSLLLVFAWMGCGCAGGLEKRSRRLELGMPREDAVRLMGRKHQTIAAREEANAQRSEVLRYNDPESGELLLYFRDGRLVQWGDPSVLRNMPGVPLD